MTARSSALGSVNYETETNWGENTSTFGTRLETVGAVDLSSFSQEKVSLGITVQRPHEGAQHVRGVQGGSFTIRLPLAGHGGTAAGALTATDLTTLLANYIGATDTATVAAGMAGTGTAAAPDMDAGGTWAANTLAHFGALKDTRAEGQWGAIASESGNTLTMLTALPANGNGTDVAYGAVLVYPSETPGTAETITSTRWMLQTGNKQIAAHGVFPNGQIRFSGFNAGEVPHVELGYGVSWFDPDHNATFPDTTATDAKTPRPVAAGEMVIEAVGTTTRTTYSVRNVEFTVNMEVVPLMGPGGVDGNQVIVGARRTRCQSMISMEFDAEAVGTQTWSDLWNTAESSIVNRHILYGLTIGDGTALALYMPNARIVGDRPIQHAADGLNRVRVTFEGLTNSVTTNDRTLANFQLAFG
jgi:hypothetical protein